MLRIVLLLEGFEDEKHTLTKQQCPGARTYILECAEIIDNEPLAWTQIHVGGKLSCLVKQLIPGHRYAFRLAALGGADGRSPWSPTVERMAA